MERRHDAVDTREYVEKHLGVYQDDSSNVSPVFVIHYRNALFLRSTHITGCIVLLTQGHIAALKSLCCCWHHISALCCWRRATSLCWNHPAAVATSLPHHITTLCCWQPSLMILQEQGDSEHDTTLFWRMMPYSHRTVKESLVQSRAFASGYTPMSLDLVCYFITSVWEVHDCDFFCSSPPPGKWIARRAALTEQVFAISEPQADIAIHVVPVHVS